jgi:Beta-galactosidase/beta-glucuronidase
MDIQGSRRRDTGCMDARGSSAFNRAAGSNCKQKVGDPTTIQSWNVTLTDVSLLCRLDDPHLGLNELKARWVNKKAWVYRHVFQRPEIPAGATAALVFDGLDTFASVKLNGETILRANNMFLGYRVDITEAMGSPNSTNVLEIEFDCAETKATELRNKDPNHKWVGLFGDPARLGVRKAQYHWVGIGGQLS